MSQYFPDSWTLIRIKHKDDVIDKVVGGWSGSYLNGSSWRMNSGIAEVIEEDEKYIFRGHSGSEYHCGKEAQRETMAMGGAFAVLDQAIQRANNKEENSASFERITIEDCIAGIA